jgi:osmoprotectant transport system permease protein
MILRLFLLFLVPALCFGEHIKVGSKRFTESYILGEIVAQTVTAAGEVQAVHNPGLGNTAIVFAALKGGSIDVYPEYTGTIAFELLGRREPASAAEINAALAAYGLGIAVPLGFSNSYAFGMTEARARALNVRSISDLGRHPDARVGLSQEFLNRRDGWPALKARYQLPFEPRGLDHGLAYEALAGERLDVIDVYSTDAKIARYHLQVLDDDKKFFPAYDAVLLYRLDFPRRFPKSWAALQKLGGRITPERMIAMNAQAEVNGKSFQAAAHEFVSSGTTSVSAGQPRDRSFAGILFGPDLLRLTLEHLGLVIAALVPAVAIGVPLGILAAHSRRAGRVILPIVGLLQTIPALALLAFLITFMGTIGAAPAIAALFLYALLPITRNTLTGLTDLAPSLRESARALGLPTLARLRRIELPLASRSIIAGVKTSAVIAVGTATIAAFIGAGGYGERIVAGLAVNDTLMLLAGAIPAAALALAVEWLFAAAERFVVPAGLRNP